MLACFPAPCRLPPAAFKPQKAARSLLACAAAARRGDQKGVGTSRSPSPAAPHTKAGQSNAHNVAVAASQKGVREGGREGAGPGGDAMEVDGVGNGGVKERDSGGDGEGEESEEGGCKREGSQPADTREQVQVGG